MTTDKRLLVPDKTKAEKRLERALNRLRAVEDDGFRDLGERGTGERIRRPAAPIPQAIAQPTGRPVPGTTITPEQAQTRKLEQGGLRRLGGVAASLIGGALPGPAAEAVVERGPRAAELAERPFQAAGAATGPLIEVAVPGLAGQALGARQEGAAVLDLGQQLLTGSITPREFAGRLIEIQESKPILQQLISELPVSLVPPIGAVQKGVKTLATIEKLSEAAVRTGRLRVGPQVVQAAQKGIERVTPAVRRFLTEEAGFVRLSRKRTEEVTKDVQASIKRAVEEAGDDLDTMVAEVRSQQAMLEAEMGARDDLKHALRVSKRGKQAMQRSRPFPGMDIAELRHRWELYDEFLQDPIPKISEVFEQQRTLAPETQRGAVQAGMGIGERPAQGELLAEFQGAGGRVPLTPREPLEAAQASRQAVAKGQQALPETGGRVTPTVPSAAESGPLTMKGFRAETGTPGLRPSKSFALVREMASPETPVGAKAPAFKIVEETVTLQSPLRVKGLQGELLEQWAKGGDAEAARILAIADQEGLPPPGWYRQADTYIARQGTRLGHDGVFYDAGRRSEIAVFTEEAAGGRAAPTVLSAAETARPPTGLQTPQRARGKAGVSGGQPPRQPPKITPDGTHQPLPDFDATRDKLVGILKTSVRRSQKELETLRKAERSRRAAMVESGFQRAQGAGEAPIARIRAAQRGEFPTPELELSERLTVDEVSVLRNSIYDSLGHELRQTAANVDVALSRLATEGKLPTPSELKWMEEVFGDDFTKAILDFRTRGQKALELALEIWNLPRALLASFDDSAVLRQGGMLIPEGSPVAKAWIAHWKVIKKTGFDALNQEVRANPWFNQGRANGLDLTLPSAARGIAGREEVFFGAGLVQRIPVIKQTIGKGVEISERLYSSYLNKLRMDVYASHAAELTRMKASPAAFKELAANINILSGRASLGKAEAIAPLLNGLFFSAKLNWARAQAPFRILRQAPNLGTEEGRHLATMLARDVYGYWAGILGMLGLASAAGVAAVEWNPRSSDFAKMQVGTVRVDPWGGQQQFAVLMARIITGERKTTTTRQEVPADLVETLARFIESKAHPALGQLIAIKKGKTFVGEDLTVNEYAKMWFPLFSQDVKEVFEGTSPGVATVLGLVAFEGISVYNIPGVPAVLLNQLQDAVDQYNDIPTDRFEIEEGDPTRLQFRKSNPDTDAALFLAGQVTSLRTREAVNVVVTLIQEHNLKPDDIRGIEERKDRQKKAFQAKRLLERNAVDLLIDLLEQPDEQQPEASTPEPTPEQRRPSSLKDIFEQMREPQPVGGR